MLLGFDFCEVEEAIFCRFADSFLLLVFLLVEGFGMLESDLSLDDELHEVEMRLLILVEDSGRALIVDENKLDDVDEGNLDKLDTGIGRGTVSLGLVLGDLGLGGFTASSGT